MSRNHLNLVKIGSRHYQLIASLHCFRPPKQAITPVAHPSATANKLNKHWKINIRSNNKITVTTLNSDKSNKYPFVTTYYLRLSKFGSFRCNIPSRDRLDPTKTNSDLSNNLLRQYQQVLLDFCYNNQYYSKPTKACPIRKWSRRDYETRRFNVDT